MTGTPLDILLSQLNGPNLDRVVRLARSTDIYFKNHYEFTSRRGDKHGAIVLMIWRHKGGEISASLPYIRADGLAAEELTILHRAYPTPEILEKLRKHLRVMGVLT